MNTQLWMIAVSVLVSFISVSDSAQGVADGGNSGFISIDCGASTDYVDEVTGIWYQTDEGFIGSGSNQKIPPRGIFNSESYILQQLMTLRSFPDGKRNCYTLKPKQEKKHYYKYFIRATFAYGNYDFTDQVPAFDLYLGVNYWATVRVPSENCFEHKEIVMQQQDISSTETIQVCLINTGEGTPFVNTLELRPLNNSLYSAPLPLAMEWRVDCGSKVWTTSNRYKDDVYDRIWWNDLGSKWGVLIASEQGKVEDSAYELPSEILRTASQPLNNSNILTWSLTFDIYQQYHLFLHFAEIQKLPPGHKRIINVTFDDDDENSLSQELTLEYLKPVTLSSDKFTKGFVGFTVTTAAHLNTPPILNAYEIYSVVQQPNSPTDPQDASAILDIKHTYGISRISWQGDPCVPSCFTWDGLNCSSDNNIRIISLNLSSSNITGQITTLLAKLEILESLDLSNNELIGQLPEFLATLPNLMFINVAGNKLTGSIPKALSEKANLQLSVANNPGLCQTNSCKEHKFVFPLIPSIGAFFIVVVFVSLVIWRFRKKKVFCTESPKMEVLKQKNQAYPYSDVLQITNNFETVIGEGGFGKVYLGILRDETQAELLTTIHHKNLVSLVGFCDDNGVKALIYEYMDLGDLSQLLSEKNSKILKWNERLQVAVDAAKGLRYLHDGCETPIIHRDLKPSNVLLNKFTVAKIADFGLSRAFKNERDSHISTQPAGTPGYVDPEFQRTGNLNKTSDIYSFGMILIHLITSRPPIVRRELDNVCFIVDWIQPKIDCGDIQGIVDPRLTGQFLVASAWKAVEIAMSCISPESTQRPNISCVLHQLKQCLAKEMDHAKSNYTGQFEPITILSAR